MTLLQLVALVSVVTAVLWMPYIVERMLRQGIPVAVGNPPPGGFPAAPWAHRAHAAHDNAVANLAIFGTLALAAEVSGVGNSPGVLLAAKLFLGARIAHFVFYVAGVPWLRTGAFIVGFTAQALLAIAVLS